MTNNFKYTAIGLIIAMILFFSGLLVGRYKFYKTEIKVIKRVVTKTEWKYAELKKPAFTEDNFNRLLFCVNSDLIAKENVKDNWLNITVADECKSIDLKYRIGTAGNMRLYFTVGIAGLVVGAGTGIFLYHKFK
jgi:hypothetical protein